MTGFGLSDHHQANFELKNLKCYSFEMLKCALHARKPASRQENQQHRWNRQIHSKQDYHQYRNSKTEHNYPLHLQLIPEQNVRVEEEKKNPETVIIN